jgi:hypothetical protein
LIGTFSLQPSLNMEIKIPDNLLTRPAVLKTLPKLKIQGGKMPGTQSTVKR